MADRVYPSSKQNNTTANPSFPATKSQLYATTRPTYRPQPPPPPRRRRSRCCSCCLWLTLIIFLLLLLSAATATVFYFLYRPHRPDFQITSVKLSQFNLTKSDTLVTKFNLTISSRNPNSKLVFVYDPIHASMTTSRNVDLGNATIPAFTHATKNTTTLRASIGKSGGEVIGDGDLITLRSGMKSKSGLPIEIQLDTKVKVKIGGVNTQKVKIRVFCDGIKATVPIGNNTVVTASTKDAKCKVNLRFKIWKWTF